MTKYTTIAGTEPSEDERHEPRTLERADDDGSVFMMTEIEDGLFVQWSRCDKCQTHFTGCKCAGGPQMPKYMADWRDKRFANSIKGRKTRQQAEKVAPEQAEQEADMRQNVDDGLDKAKAAVEAATKENSDD